MKRIFTILTAVAMAASAALLTPSATYTMTVQAWGTDNYPSGVSAPLTVTIPQTVPAR